MSSDMWAFLFSEITISLSVWQWVAIGIGNVAFVRFCCFVQEYYERPFFRTYWDAVETFWSPTIGHDFWSWCKCELNTWWENVVSSWYRIVRIHEVWPNINAGTLEKLQILERRIFTLIMDLFLFGYYCNNRRPDQIVIRAPPLPCSVCFPPQTPALPEDPEDDLVMM